MEIDARRPGDFTGYDFREVEKMVMLQMIDKAWKNHLYDLDHLKTSISFRSWGQKDPLVEYKQDAYEMFVAMMADLRKSVTQNFFRAQIGAPPQARPQPRQRLVLSGPSDTPDTAAAPAPQEPVEQAPRVDALGVSRRARVAEGAPAGPDPRTLTTNREDERPKAPAAAAVEPGRNDPCPCGSGKKYKKCHGAGA